ncbi:MAG: PEP-CTERM/exosortase system-associated acyltransferase [Desulfocapsaceae bacterium]|nr:PEP-CTERM/exosortase system-associated acyltransferase [Desulfocapsaceae bacterium]
MNTEIQNIGSTRDPLVPHFTFTGKMHTSIDPILLVEIFRLRYEVYCLECQFLDPLDYPDGLEIDSYDQRSFHVASHNFEGLLVGSMRFVLANECQEFPFQEHCSTFDDFTFPPREQCGEVSRLVVRKNYRRRVGDSLQGMSKGFQEQGNVSNIGQQEHNTENENSERRSNSPQILIGMYREIFRFCRRNGVNYCFAAMERGLARILNRIGLRFISIGPQTDYYGKVVPYIINLDIMEADLLKANAFLGHWFKEDPETPYAAE